MIDFRPFEFGFTTVLHQFGVGTRITDHYQSGSERNELSIETDLQKPTVYFVNVSRGEERSRCVTDRYGPARLNFPRIDSVFHSALRTRFPLRIHSMLVDYRADEPFPSMILAVSNLFP